MSDERQKGFKDALEAIKHELTRIYGVWSLLLGLYGPEERRDFIFKRAANFFWTISDPLIDYVILAIAKLLELSPSRGKEEPSLLKIVRIIEPLNEADLCRELRRKVRHLKRECEDIKTYRDNRIAHLHFQTHMESEPDLPTSITRNKIELVLKEIDKFVNRAARLIGEEWSFIVAGEGGAAKENIIRLAQSARYEELQSEGKIPNPDFDLAKYSTI